MAAQRRSAARTPRNCAPAPAVVGHPSAAAGRPATPSGIGRRLRRVAVSCNRPTKAGKWRSVGTGMRCLLPRFRLGICRPRRYRIGRSPGSHATIGIGRDTRIIAQMFCPYNAATGAAPDEERAERASAGQQHRQGRRTPRSAGGKQQAQPAGAAALGKAHSAATEGGRWFCRVACRAGVAAGYLFARPVAHQQIAGMAHALGGWRNDALLRARGRETGIPACP